MRRSTTLVLALAFVSASCADNDDALGAPPGGGGGTPIVPENPASSLTGIDTDADGDGDGIVDLPASVDSFISDVFQRYTAVETAAGGRVHLLAEAGVDDSKLRRAAMIMGQHLANLPGSSQGADKSDVATAMSQRGATLAIFQNQASADPSDPEVAAFYLRMGEHTAPILATRIIVEGTPEYIAAAPMEDNTFGVSAALIYRLGLRNARPTFAAELETLSQAAIAAGTFVPPAGPLPGNLDDAFMVLAMDVHSGVWGHDPRGDGRSGSEFEYGFATRADQSAGDPLTAAWIGSFFTGEHSFHALIDPDFSGNFDGLRRSSTPYSARSQYLRSIQLTGSNTAELFGAPSPSLLMGNDGNNNIKGRAGDDHLIGGAGFDTAVFSGPMANYDITIQGSEIIVEDLLGGHDGRDTLEGIQRLQFTDQGINL